MTRPSDAIKQHASFVVHEKAGEGLFVKSSHFEVGYTPAYCATVEEAIDFAMQKRAAEIRQFNDEIAALAEARKEAMNLEF